jgi:hypothetical protein
LLDFLASLKWWLFGCLWILQPLIRETAGQVATLYGPVPNRSQRHDCFLDRGRLHFPSASPGILRPFLDVSLQLPGSQRLNREGLNEHAIQLALMLSHSADRAWFQASFGQAGEVRVEEFTKRENSWDIWFY